MGFSTKQVQALQRNLDHRYIRTREAHGRELSYIEGWLAISEANRIFGFDGWNRETIESRCVLAWENRGNFPAVYIARVRITPAARISFAKATAPAKGRNVPGRSPRFCA
jgi:recombination DNA repair RAD52 pathway protein